MRGRRLVVKVNKSNGGEGDRAGFSSLRAFALLLLASDLSFALIPSGFKICVPVPDASIGSLRPGVSLGRNRGDRNVFMMSDSADTKGAGADELQQNVLQAASQRSPLPLPQFECCGLAASASRELVVIGTAHSPCRSADEVSAVIQKASPDVVVVELDQERLELLLRDERPGERRYGEDFVAAVTAATSVGAPVILGDAKARDTYALIGTPGPIADGARLARAFQLRFGKRGSSALRVKPVSLLGSFIDDPGKLLPLLAGVWLPVLLAPFVLLSKSLNGDSTIEGWVAAEGWVTALSYVLLAGVLLLSARIFDVVLLSRDEVLTKSALRGLELGRGLRTGELLRRRYQFSTDPAMLAGCPLPESGTMPFFTLRRPLRKGEVRRLNLFEPRWLCLLDSIASSNSADGDLETPPAPERLLNATFGCVFAANRYYVPAENSWASDDSDDRVADVVLRPVARLARIISAKASTRPVSGARRIEIEIVGEEPLQLDSSSLAPTEGGYLAGKVTPGTEAEYDAALAPRSSALSSNTSDGGITRVVAVVGLLHANGVLDRCVDSKLQDSFALARWLKKESADWVGY